MKAIADKDRELFIRRMAGKLRFFMKRDKPAWECDHESSFSKTKLVLEADLKYSQARIAFVIESCHRAEIKCDCDLMFNLDKI